MIPGAQKRKADFTDVVMYVAIATKHLRMIILLITLSLSAGLLFYIFSRPVYYSKSTIRYTAIGTQTPDADTRLKGEDFRRFSDNAFLNDFDADHIVKKTDAKLGNYGEVGRPKKEFLKQVRATWTTDHNIELNVWAYKPEWVRLFPSNMVEVFLEDRRERALRQYQAETNKFQAVIADLSVRWQEQLRVEGRLTAEFNPEKLKFELDQLQTVPRSLDLFRRKLQEWTFVDNKVNNPVYSDSERLQFYYSIDYNVDAGTYVEMDAVTRERLPANARPSNGTVIIRPGVGRSGADEWYELEQEKVRLERLIKELSLTFKPSHPKMQVVNQQHSLIERKVKETLSQARAKFEIHGRRLKQKVAELEAQEPLWKEQRERYDKYLQEYNLIKQGGIRYDSMISEMQKQMAEAALALRNERVDLKFMDFDSIRDEIPISPNRLKIVMMALGLGVALALGVPFLLEFMDQTVTNMEKMEEATNVRGLGLVPDFEDEIAESYPLILNDGVANPDFIENFRVIRTNLLSSAATSKFPQVIMVTSTTPKEGKTVVASNLALSFAQMGEKTLIVDANLRRGIQHHLFGSRSAPGLSNVLVEKYDVEDACRPTTMENLHILPCGDELEGDIEQLGAPAFVLAIEKLRKRYQRIIVDSTPVLGLAETSIMQPAMDGVVLVIQCGQTPTRAVRTAIEILEANHANFYGFVLNRLDLMATMNRFHYYYYTNHYYNRYQSLTRAKG